MQPGRCAGRALTLLTHGAKSNNERVGVKNSRDGANAITGSSATYTWSPTWEVMVTSFDPFCETTWYFSYVIRRETNCYVLN